MARVNAIYFGKIDAMVAEVSAFDPRAIEIPAVDCRYLVMPSGDVDFDVEWFSTATEAKAAAAYLAGVYGVAFSKIG